MFTIEIIKIDNKQLKNKNNELIDYVVLTVFEINSKGSYTGSILEKWIRTDNNNLNVNVSNFKVGNKYILNVDLKGNWINLEPIKSGT